MSGGVEQVNVAPLEILPRFASCLAGGNDARWLMLAADRTEDR
jgi:hypothetical protein